MTTTHADTRSTIQQVAVAGATGHVGREIVRLLLSRGILVRALVRNPAKLERLDGPLDIRRVQLTDAESIRGQLTGVDAVVSALGKTTQRGGASRRAVDVDANLDLLDEARHAGVGRFAFVSVATAHPDHPVAMVRMKGEVERAIEQTAVDKRDLDGLVVQPTGYFTDMWQALEMARRGTYWVIGDGAMRFNPIHPRDVAEVVVDRLLHGSASFERLPIGGPETFDTAGLVRVCEAALGRSIRVRHVPLWLARAAVAAIRPVHEDIWQLADFFTGNVVYARRELGDDASLPAVGKARLIDYFRTRLLDETTADGDRLPDPHRVAVS
ncbi:MAG: NAD(P)H-binding protein [Acidobacteriota bacterium]